ncbi:MAG: hypothetical protein KJS97_14905 [Alphaproteobacteria bacterium]|nr:hypothetical protein [Alphaproteobacteria bacterium]
MTALLTALSVFHLFVGTGALALGVRMSSGEGKSAWRSPLLRRIAMLIAWTYPLIALGCVAMAWRTALGADPHYAPLWAIAPLIWLVLKGLAFAVIDVLEDGVFGNALYRPGERPEG